MRVPAEDIRQVAQVVDGVEYRSERGFFDMPDRHATAHLRSAGYGGRWHVPGIARRGAGFTCQRCGFQAFFTTCGRCGGVCTKGAADAA